MKFVEIFLIYQRFADTGCKKTPCIWCAICKNISLPHTSPGLRLFLHLCLRVSDVSDVYDRNSEVTLRHCWTESCFSEWEVVVGIFQQRKQTGGNQLIITSLPKQKYFTIWDNENYFRKISVKLFHHNFYKFSSRKQGIEIRLIFLMLLELGWCR